MLSIVRRLGKNDVGDFTQSIEKDVIESLEELVAALQSEIENRKKPGKPAAAPPKKSGNEENEKQLVEQIAELKMLRSLQLRVNRRTKEIGRRIHGEQATADDLAMELQRWLGARPKFRKPPTSSPRDETDEQLGRSSADGCRYDCGWPAIVDCRSRKPHSPRSRGPTSMQKTDR